MSQLKRNQFRLTFLAMAVLSLSACSTTSNTGGFDFGGIGVGLGKLGDKTAELGSNAWEGTKNVLNIGDQESQNLDEVDLALMEEDADLGNGQSVAKPELAEVQLGETEVERVLPRNALKPNTAREENVLAFGQIPEPTKLLLPTKKEEGELAVLNDNDMKKTPTELQEVRVANAGTGSAQLLDMTHEVKPNENLWQIAKTTTGDANNWHVLADINNLGPNASVFEGQKLVIPADMVDAEYRLADQPVTAAAAQASVNQGTTANEELPAVALILPEAAPEPAVAAVEPVAPAAAPADDTDIGRDAIALEVGASETLWDFAKRTTGDATKWKAIAVHNKYDEQKIGLIRAGQKIYVPIDIVRARDMNGELIAKGEEALVPGAKVGGVVPNNELAIAATAAVMTGTNQPAETPSTAMPEFKAVVTKPEMTKPEAVEDDIKIVEAAFQSDGGIMPVTADSLAEEASLAAESNGNQLGKVMVKGTYYPKAVYNNADFSSSLLMRVSPGTQLLVSKAIGPWLEVKTDKGVGYVHSRDIK